MITELYEITRLLYEYIENLVGFLSKLCHNLLHHNLNLVVLFLNLVVLTLLIYFCEKRRPYISSVGAHVLKQNSDSLIAGLHIHAW